MTGASIAAAAAVGSNTTISGTPTTAGPPTHPLDEIMAMLKTGYPLLALSMETMVDQIQLKFKPQADEDMYRLVVALYNEGAQVSPRWISMLYNSFNVFSFSFSNSNYFLD